MAKRTLLEKVARHIRAEGRDLPLTRLETAVNSWSSSLPDLSERCWQWTGSSSATAPLIRHNYVVSTVPRLLFTEIHGAPLDPSWKVVRDCPTPMCPHPGHYQMAQQFNRFGRSIAPLPQRFRVEQSIVHEGEDFDDLVAMIAAIGGQRTDPEILAAKPGWGDYSTSMIKQAQAAIVAGNL